jgi:hypothetical protein
MAPPPKIVKFARIKKFLKRFFLRGVSEKLGHGFLRVKKKKKKKKN